MNRKKVLVLTVAATAGICLIAANAAKTAESVSQQSRASATVTNENGCVSRTFVERTITTNGNMVTEHRRETRTNTDVRGSVLETSTSEYTQSYPVGDTGFAPPPALVEEPSRVRATSFLGLAFGEPYADKKATYETDPDEPALLRTKFTPKRKLAGFDDYYVCVTPMTHKIAKILACARQPVEPGVPGHRHYLIQALEKKFGTGARLTSFWNPWYVLDLGAGRYAKALLDEACDAYATVIIAWDDTVRCAGEDEFRAKREAARKEAESQRARRAQDAADAF